MRLKDLATGVRDLLMFDPRDLVVEEGFNLREDYGDIEELADDIALNGVRVPLEIRLSPDGEAVINDGHRRHRACLRAIEKGADIKAVPCVPEPKGMTAAERVASQFTRNSGKPFEPFEERALFARLLSLGWKTDQIAAKIGRSTAYVSGRLDLGQAVPEMMLALSAGTISTTAAQKLSKATPETQRAVLATAVPGKRVKVTDAAKAAGVKTRKARKASTCIVKCPHCHQEFDANE